MNVLTDFDDADEIDIQDISSHPFPEPSSGSAAERLIRKRSSKACDNCRKAKCKCERTAKDEPCKTCVVNNQECTFLGPSRKRGPPKGYIDALESKLHQLEALFGSILLSQDPRARSLIFDLSQSEFAREVIKLVDESAYGEKGRSKAQHPIPSAHGRRRDSVRLQNSMAHARASPDTPPTFGIMDHHVDGLGNGSGSTSVGSLIDWQGKLIELIAARPHERATPQQLQQSSVSSSSFPFSDKQGPSSAGPSTLDHLQFGSNRNRSLDVKSPLPNYAFNESNPHQRRRLDSSFANTYGNFFDGNANGNLSIGIPDRLVPSQSHQKSPDHLHHGLTRSSHSSGSLARLGDASGSLPQSGLYNNYNHRDRASTSRLSHDSHGAMLSDDESSGEDSSDFADAVGQLSINELHQVRYHGKASGLHLLMPAMEQKDHGEMTDSGADSESGPSRTHTIVSDDRSGRGRVKRGIWKFPAAGVWPPVSALSTDGPGASLPSPANKVKDEQDWDTAAAQYLPPKERLREFITLYFAYVHPLLPVVYKSQFLQDFETRADPHHPGYNAARERVTNLLLLAICSLAARYSDEDGLPEGVTMWTAGDNYTEHAMDLIAQARASSRIDTVQTLLLSGYRDVGLGKMERAWLNAGMAVRLGQDLGLHRSISKWSQAGQIKFNVIEKETRCRVWHACLKLDKYVSTYIGRPVMVSENDYDTQLPEASGDEETELWVNPTQSIPAGLAGPDLDERLLHGINYVPQPSNIISCFNASMMISKFTGMIISNFYTIRPPPSNTRREARVTIERKMEKFYNELPEHLRFTPSGRVPPPHMLIVHMQYWCAVLLLHRPLLSPVPGKSSASSSSVETDEEVRKAMMICQKAAHHITDIGVTLTEAFCPRRSPAMFSYYIFSASIMHVSSLMDNPADVRAREGLEKARKILKSISVIWPSALRAWDLLDGVKAEIRMPGAVSPPNNNAQPDRKKRLLVDTEPPAMHTGPVSAVPSTSNHRSSSTRRSPGSGSRRRSTSISDGRFKSQSSSASFRMEPLQMSQPSPYMINSAGSDGLKSHSQMMAENASNNNMAAVQHQGKPLNSFHPPTSVHRPWGATETNNLYQLDQSRQMSDEMHGHSHQSSVPSQQQVQYEGHYTGQDYQRQVVDNFFPGVSNSARPTTASPFQELFQSPPDVMSDGQRYATSAAPANRGLWNGYTANESYEATMLPGGGGGSYVPALNGTRSVSAGDSAMAQSTNNMLPPMMLPVDGYTRSMQTSPVTVDPESYSGLASYFGQTGGTPSAFVSGNLHRQNGHM
ncbi:hypothetical protein FRB95_009858 [Tulasnella sp. JGI-2019a]|nr:hypothetical protein FRB95_009858 [Tulasnella sp. JGI-2019a]